nr:RNA polymerase sigma-70 factor [uncultured Allomuricauda sp.]
MRISSKNTNNLLVGEFEIGNEKAFRKLFEMFWEPMFVDAKSIVSDADAAKDIVQNIWTNIWQKRKTRKIENFEGYVYKAVKYSCYKYLRDNKFDATHIEIIESLQLNSRPEIEKQYDFEETQTLLQDSLDKLPPRCRQVFKLSRLEEVSNEEIANLLGISKRTVENQMSIALKSIRQQMTTVQSIVTAFLSCFFIF